MDNSGYIEKEKELKRERKFLRDVMATIPDSLLILDRELRIKNANRSFYKLFQMKPGGIIGRKIADILGDEDGKLSAKLGGLLGTKDTLENFELHHQSEKLGERILNITARGIIVAEEEEEEEEEELVVICDITERKQAEELFRSLAMNSPVGVYIVQKGKFCYTNPQFQEDTGYREDELLGMESLSLVIPEDRKTVRENAIQMLKGKRIAPYEFRIINKNGDIRWALETVAPMHYHGEQATIGSYQDITERKQAEEALRESEENYKGLAESITDVFFAFDKELRYTYWNRASEELVGISAKDALGKHLYDIFPDTEMTRSAEEAYLKVLKTKQPQHFINQYQLQGKDFFFEISAYPSKNGLSVFVKDTTERKRVEHNLVERMKELYCLYSISRITEREGITLDELYQEVANVLPPSWQYPEITCARLTINGKEFETANYRDTEWKQSSDIKVYGAKTGVVEVNYLEERPELDEGPFLKEERALIDAVAELLGRITERKQGGEALKESEARYRALIDLGAQVGEAIVMLLDEEQKEGVQVFFSDTWLQITGYSREELRNMSFFELLLPQNHKASLARHRRRISGESIPGLFELTIIRKDGSEVPIEVTSAHSTYLGKRVSVVYVRDITERKKTEQQLMVNDRLASIGELASGIAHELNNPLTGIIGLSDLLLATDLSDEVKEDLQMINREAHRTAQVVKNLLTFARKHPQEKKPEDLKNAIGLVLELRAYEQRVQNIQVITRFAPDLPQVMANASQLVQAFVNIITNAEYFMIEAHGKGTLTITTERVGDFVRVTLADDGPGISKKNLRKLFIPFFTTKEVGKGTGLGLSICHGIVTEHGGRIWAESKLGKGARFIVELPIYKVAAEKE